MNSVERRTNKRYPIALKVLLLKKDYLPVLTGLTLDISRSHVMMHCDTENHNCVLRDVVILRIAWPCQLSDGASLILQWTGNIIRIDECRIVISHRAHKFVVGREWPRMT